IREETDVVTCGLIVSEVLQGLRQAKSRLNIERHFREMDWLSPKEPDTYIEAADLFRRLRARGITIRSTIDCVIANLAAHHDAVILRRTATSLSSSSRSFCRFGRCRCSDSPRPRIRLRRLRPSAPCVALVCDELSG